MEESHPHVAEFGGKNVPLTETELYDDLTAHFCQYVNDQAPLSKKEK